MIDLFVPSFLLLALCGRPTQPVFSAHAPAPSTSSDKSSQAESSEKATRPIHITPGLTDGRIAWVAASFLEANHYLHLPFDHALSSRFLDRYLEALDPQHLHFLKTDLAQFEHYRTALGDMTVTRSGVADTTPACEIFNRFIERFQQRVAYADELLKNDK